MKLFNVMLMTSIFASTVVAVRYVDPSPAPPMLVTGCSPAANRKIVDVLVREALAECVAENPTLGKIELQKICGFTEDEWPLVEHLLGAHRKGAARAAASLDAGRD